MTESNTDKPADRTPSIGEILQKAREERDLTQQDIAQSLRLSPDMIAALETGSAEQRAGKVYVQGYLRAYARLVDVAPEVVAPDDVTTLQAQQPFTPSTIQRSRPKKGYRRTSGPRPLVIGVIGLGAVILLTTQLWPLFQDEKAGFNVVAIDPQQAEEETSSVQPSIFAEQDAQNTDQPIADETVQLPQATTADDITADPASTPRLTQDQTDPQPSSATTEDDSESVVVSEEVPIVQVVLHFDADSWTEVNDARGERLMQRIGRMGSTIELSGVAPFDVLMGYAPGVNIEYNGEPYDDTRYQDRRVARISIGETGDSATP